MYIIKYENCQFKVWFNGNALFIVVYSEAYSSYPEQGFNILFRYRTSFYKSCLVGLIEY